jgi:dihydroorotate dehydrogenase (NAD+) catalytic subunit
LELTLPDTAGPAEAFEIVAAVRAQTLLPLWAKLPLFRAEELAEPCLEGGANALTVGRQPVGLSLDLHTNTRLVGRLHGVMVKALALRAVEAVARQVNVPVIACGGIHTLEDAVEFLAMGASALQVGSATWVDPTTMARILAGIEARMARPGDVLDQH